MMEKEMRVAAINDISGAGKCALTIALPVLSALGCEVSVLPTAVLSTHTGGFTSPVYVDMTDEMSEIAKHWKREGAVFEAMYSGFLGSERQIDIVREIFRMNREVNPEVRILVDPVMGDHGKLYKTYTDEMADGMIRLCREADIIVPNMTEAYRILSEEYRDGPYTAAEIERILEKLSALGPDTVILTGVWFDSDKIGAACFDRERREAKYILNERVPGAFHGTGDLFASILLGVLMRGGRVEDACACAARGVAECIKQTVEDGREDTRWGVKFEKCLPFLMKDVFALAK